MFSIMQAKPPTLMTDLLCKQGFIHAKPEGLTDIQQNTDYQCFRQSWNRLPLDGHLRDEGKYRFRRYAVFNSIAGKLEKLPSEPHFQSLEYNAMHGGSYRYFEDIEAEIIESPILKNLIDWNLRLIASEKANNWRVQCHQFRIRASRTETGKPSPEGVHQDGADYVFIMLLDRENVLGGHNTLHNKAGKVIYEVTLAQSGEALLVDDKRYWHGVSELRPQNKSKEAHRDVLVLTFHKIEHPKLT